MEDSTCKIFFTLESVTSTRSVPKVWDINGIQSTLGPNVCHNIWLYTRFFGCDTVSMIYVFGKGTGYKKCIDYEQSRTYCYIWDECDSELSQTFFLNCLSFKRKIGV